MIGQSKRFVFFKKVAFACFCVDMTKSMAINNFIRKEEDTLNLYLLDIVRLLDVGIDKNIKGHDICIYSR